MTSDYVIVWILLFFGSLIISGFEVKEGEPSGGAGGQKKAQSK